MNMRTLIVALSLFFISHTQSNEPDYNAHLSQEYCNLADYYEQMGKEEKAITLYTKALSLNKANPHALVKLGNINYKANDTNQAIENYHLAVKEKPDDAHLRFNLGLCLQQKEMWPEAAEQFAKAAELDSHHLKAHIYAASAYEKTQQPESAISLLERATALDPQSFDIHHRLGNVYRHFERLEDAINPYKKAVALQPDNIHVMMDLANCLNMLNRNEESLEMYQKILEKNPNVISALYNFGFTLKKMDLLDRALEVYKRVLEKKPDYAPVHFSLSSIYLATGNLERGWDEYEWRWKTYTESAQKFNIPLWNGEDLSNKQLLIYAEQGLGDTFQFVRYAKELKKRYPTLRIIFETQQALTELLKLQGYLDLVIPRKNQMPYCDYQIPVMSIPRIVRTRLDSIPADIPYIKASSERFTYWKNKLSSDKSFKIGICWQGNAQYSTQTLRRAVLAKSISLETFKPLTEIPGVTIYSLQQVNGLEQLEACSFKNKVITFDKEFDKKYGSFMDSAAVVQHLNLVISVDTGLCHLAAAINVPTWILLPFPADWRWLRDRNDSPWYPSVRLFRQQKPGEWHSTMQDVTDALKQKLNLPVTTNQHDKTNTNFHKPTPEQLQFFEQLLDSLN